MAAWKVPLRRAYTFCFSSYAGSAPLDIEVESK
jgi:hypothetical protein